MKKPLSAWTEAEQQLRLSQLKSLKMPRAVLRQSPALGTLGFVVYAPDSVFPRLVSLLFNVALFSPSPPSTPTSWSPHVLTYNYTTQKSLLRVPARRGRRSSPLDYSSQKHSEVLPLSFPGPQFTETSVSRRFSSYSVSSRAGWASAGQEAHSDDVIPRDRTHGFLSSLFFSSLSYPFYRPSRLA